MPTSTNYKNGINNGFDSCQNYKKENSSCFQSYFHNHESHILAQYIYIYNKDL
jgi:hypothetical protein